jgi:universal stress protein E
MPAIRRILVAIKDPRARSLPAVVKATQLARKLGAKLELFHALASTLYTDVYWLNNKSLPQMERTTRARSLQQLEAIAAPLRRKGLTVTVAAEWDFPAYEAILRRANRSKADLIVAETHAGRRIAPLLLHLTDWELLRLSPVPVLLVKSSRPYRRPVVLAAVDPSHEFAKPARLDEEILRAGKLISGALGGALHAVHAYMTSSVVLADMDSIKAGVLTQIEKDAAATARTRLERVVRSADMTRRRRHLIRGPAFEAIPVTARSTRSAIVVMGAVSRSGLKRAFIGNTAERILDAIACDVLVVKPRHFANRVPRVARGPRYGVLGPMMSM